MKCLQPWVGFIFEPEEQKPKKYEIRQYDNKYRGWFGLLASGWDSTFGDFRKDLNYFCLLGFCEIIHTKQYFSAEEFNKDYIYHRNPPERYIPSCYAWLLRSPLPIKPLYYYHSKNKNKGKDPLIFLIGQHTRCRISTDELLGKVEFL